MLYCYDNETIKWTSDDTNYCLHIWSDNGEECNPRDYDHDSIMACFYGRYNLGDDIEEDTPEKFWNSMVFKYCSDEEIYNALISCSLNDLATIRDEIDEGCYNVWAIHKENGEVIKDEVIYDNDSYVDSTMEEIVNAVVDELSIRDCMKLLEKKVVWLPLWVYEHSGITMSCGERTYPYNDMFDSSCAGWIVTVLSDFNEKNKTIAEQNMKLEVEEYDSYLTGEVYGYTFYEQDGWKENDIEESAEPNWVEIDSCGGFIGNDPIKNGMSYNAGNGLEEAIESDNYETGEAKKVVTTSWYF